MESPKCPEGCVAPVARLAGSDAYNRYQCGGLDCLKTWDVPRDGVKRVLPDYSKVPEGEMKCDKCGKGFKYEAAKDKHEAKCQDDGPDGSVEESPDLPVRRNGKAPHGLNGLTEATDSMIRALEAKRDKLIQEIPELAKINAAIAALSSLKE